VLKEISPESSISSPERVVVLTLIFFKVSGSKPSSGIVNLPIILIRGVPKVSILFSVIG
jgi:hypothetical protein